MRLIDADELIKNIKNAEKCYRESKCMESPYPYKQAFADGVGAVADLIVCGEPTIEKTQAWTLGNRYNNASASPLFCMQPPRALCSEFTDIDVLSDYCPSCGAKMDEGE